MIWIEKDTVLQAHKLMLEAHGGLAGLRDEGLLDSALSRAENLYHYSKIKPSLFDLAATYAFGIGRNHPFLDGNKRTAFLIAFIFLKDNGWELVVAEEEVVLQTLALVSGELTEKEFAQWLSKNSKKLKK